MNHRERQFVVYEWRAWTNFLITRVVPNAIRVSASVFDSAEDVVPRVPITAGMFLFHVDCTFSQRFPKDRSKLIAALTRHQVRVLNGNITNISKRYLHALCVRAGLNTAATTEAGDAAELLIVKTNLNSAGTPERGCKWWQRWMMGVRLTDDIQGREEYRVMPRREVPRPWWTDRRLVIEHYVSNASQVWFRAYVFLDRLVVSQARCRLPIKRMYHATDRTNSRFIIRDGRAVATHSDPAIPSTVLQAIVKTVAVAPLDFGTLDIGWDDDGRAFILDLNVTPFCRDGSEDIIDHLRSYEGDGGNPDVQPRRRVTEYAGEPGAAVVSRTVGSAGRRQ
jgi:hypothetical protein